LLHFRLPRFFFLSLPLLGAIRIQLTRTCCVCVESYFLLLLLLVCVSMCERLNCERLCLNG
jgi:hypothetical protein